MWAELLSIGKADTSKVDHYIISATENLMGTTAGNYMPESYNILYKSVTYNYT